MEIRLLQSFLAIVWEGSITRAAEVLHISQPALVGKGHAVSLLVEGCAAYWDPARFAVRPLKPSLESTTVLTWKRGLRHTAAVQAFAEFAAERLRK